PGLKENAIALKRIEEAVALRDHFLSRLADASLMEDDEERRKALTFVFVGGGFAGIEILAELEDMVRSAIAQYETLTEADVRFVLVEAVDRVMPEVGEAQARWVVEHMRERGIDVYLETFLQDCTDKHIKLSNGEEFDADTIVWSAGVKASPRLIDSDLQSNERRNVTGRADPRVEGERGDVGARGLLAWLMHRAYHGYAIPTVDRKIKVFGNWFFNAALGRDSMPLADLDVPRKNFVEAANSKPVPKKEAAKA